MGRFTVICLLFNLVKVIVYDFSHLNKISDKGYRYYKSEIIIPVDY